MRGEEINKKPRQPCSTKGFTSDTRIPAKIIKELQNNLTKIRWVTLNKN